MLKVKEFGSFIYIGLLVTYSLVLVVVYPHLVSAFTWFDLVVLFLSSLGQSIVALCAHKTCLEYFKRRYSVWSAAFPSHHVRLFSNYLTATNLTTVAVAVCITVQLLLSFVLLVSLVLSG
jgi:hypothetical protein